MQRQPARASSGRYVSRLTSGTLAVIMAGGRGERLHDLTEHRCKPATPFGGKFRIIDFVLSNCVNSGIRQISVLTQYKAQSLIQHIQRGWSYLRGEFGEFVEVIPAQQQIGQHWYRGTADAVYQNLDFIRLAPPQARAGAGRRSHLQDGLRPDDRLPRGEGRRHHRGRGRSAVERRAPNSACSRPRNGTASRDSPRSRPSRIRCPAAPTRAGLHGHLRHSTRGCWRQLLTEDAANDSLRPRFRQEHHPEAIASNRQVFAYPFQDVKTRAQNYWRDVGTIDAFYEANIELVHVRPELNIYDQEWPIWTYQVQQPPAKFVLDEDGRRGMARQLDGLRRLHHLRRRGARVAAVLQRARRGGQQHRALGGAAERRRSAGSCRITRAILDEDCEIPDGTQIGVDRGADARRFYVTENGVVLVTPDMLRRLRSEA